MVDNVPYMFEVEIDSKTDVTDKKLRTELSTNEEKVKEMENIRKLVFDQEKKINQEFDDKKNESILLATENDEIRSRLKIGIGNKEQLVELNKEGCYYLPIKQVLEMIQNNTDEPERCSIEDKHVEKGKSKAKLCQEYNKLNKFGK